MSQPSRKAPSLDAGPFETTEMELAPVCSLDILAESLTVPNRMLHDCAHPVPDKQLDGVGTKDAL